MDNPLLFKPLRLAIFECGVPGAKPGFSGAFAAALVLERICLGSMGDSTRWPMLAI